MAPTALIDVVLEPRSLRGQAPVSGEVVRLVVDALGAGPRCVAQADRDDTPEVADASWEAALQGLGADSGIPVLLCTVTNLRPALATAARLVAEHVGDSEAASEQQVFRIVCAGGPDGAFAAEDAYLAGVCARMSLDELSVLSLLSEAAGFAMAAAQTYSSDLAGVSSGQAARELTPEQLGMASRRDCFGAVPRITANQAQTPA